MVGGWGGDCKTERGGLTVVVVMSLTSSLSLLLSSAT